MTILLVAWLTTAVASLILVDFARRWSERAGHYDHPNERSSHTTPTPRTGGVGIVLATIFILLFLQMIGGLGPTDGFNSLIAGALLVAAISFLDDLRPLSAAVRFPVHVIAAVIVVLGAGSWTWIGLLLTCIWIVAVTNIYNFMDGIDGIAGSQAVVAGVAWAILGAAFQERAIAALGGVLAAAALGFLAHNWPPARIFMGDTGSAFLGFLFAALPLVSPRRNESFLPAVLILWPFVFDGTLTILRRLLRRENIFAAHRSHLYQRLNAAGWSHARVTSIYIAIAALGAVAGITRNRFAIGATLLASIALWVFVVRTERSRQTA
jgi:UDP-N-acetylmuramyl pentapeptide phosphotransferase/UDP-N-acetylglucosamine-1-phosphate transferase